MPPPGAENDAPKKAKFEKDFIVLSEFSEQVGPIPIVSEHEGSGVGEPYTSFSDLIEQPWWGRGRCPCHAKGIYVHKYMYMTFTSDTPTCSGSRPAVMPEGIRLFFLDKELL